MKTQQRIKTAMALSMIIFCMLLNMTASATSWEWAEKMYSKATSAANAIATDDTGNSYVTGSFTDTLHIDGKYITAKGSYDVFLAKFDNRGKLLWIRQAGGIDMDEAYSVSIDREGYIYITGYISGLVEFSQNIVAGAATRDFFLTKYDSDGNVIWINLEAGENEDFGKSVCTDRNGDVYVTGVFHGTIKTERTSLKSKSAKNTFIIKHDRDGNFLWSKTGVSTGSNEPSEINVDKDGNVYLAGTFRGTAEFDKKIIISRNHKELYIVKYNSDGELQWLKKGGSALVDNSLTAIAADSSDNIIVTGSFSGTAFFGDIQLKSNGSKDFFLVKYNSKGDVLWALHDGGNGDENSRSLEVDRNGDIYLAGEFNHTFDIGKKKLTNIGDWDVFVLKYGKDGNFINGSQVGGTGFNRAVALALDNRFSIYLVGYISNNAFFGDKELVTNPPEGSGFIAKFLGLFPR
jgi:hypothetical protein